jgi:DNA-binding response OmpR family regulator
MVARHFNQGIPLPMKHLLLVDDDLVVLKLLKDYLTPLADDLSIIHADSFESGFNQYVIQGPDLIVMDINLFHQRSIPLIRQIRAHDATIPIIIYSVWEEMSRLGLLAGATCYVQKSGLRELKSVIIDLLGIPKNIP